jgi:sugar lactone lactonase YvrE
MHRLIALAGAVGALLALTPVSVSAGDAGVVRNFGPNLQAFCSNPEGIARDPRGNLYASSAFAGPSAKICVLDREGRLLRVIPVPAGAAGVASLLGELFTPGEGLYVADLADRVAGDGRLLRIDPRTGDVKVLATGFAAPNAIAQDERGDLFVSDSFAGTITKVARDGSRSVIWKQDPLLTTKGTPPFGANGLAFDRERHFLYVANTGDSRVLRIPLGADGSAGPVEVFADGATIDAAQQTTQALHGADGIMFDVRGNLYVCANQADEIQVLDPRGGLVARYAGVGADALHVPASLVFHGRTLYITDLSNSDGGVNSKLSVLRTPFPGLPLNDEEKM